MKASAALAVLFVACLTFVDGALVDATNSPTAPRDVAGTPGDGEVTVSWTPPVFDGGSPITGYTATAAPGGEMCTTTGALSCTVTGLENWTDYTFTVTATNSIGTSPASLPSAPVMPYPPASGEFTALTPTRVLDTRSGLGVGGVAEPLGPDSSIDVQITGRGGVPDVGVQAVVLNVTAVGPTAGTYVSIYPTGIDQPEISSLNTGPSETRPNLVTVGVGRGGRVTAYNFGGSTHLLFDVAGFYTWGDGPDGSRFRAIDPIRLADTRDGTGGIGTSRFGPGDTRAIRATGAGGVPASGATAVVLNVTVDAPTAWSYLTVSPADVSRPEVSNLNYATGDTVANQVIVRVPSDGMIDIYNAFGEATVIIDLTGYYDDGGSDFAGRFFALDPWRLFDTRSYSPFPPPGNLWPGDGIYDGWDDDESSAYALNVTVTGTTGVGYIVTYPYPGDPPATSTVNYGPTDTVANHAIVGCGPYMGFLNEGGTTHLIVDVFGFFT